MLKIVNRKAYHEFAVLQDFTAGIVLVGTEVKSIRKGDATISDSFIFLKDGEVFIKNMKVAKFKESHVVEKHDESRDKKLLLSRREISQIEKLMQDKGTTIVPLEVFSYKNLIKVKIGVVRGKKLWDKRQDLKKKDAERELRRAEIK
jgi:SsrA-binding protein